MKIEPMPASDINGKGASHLRPYLYTASSVVVAGLAADGFLSPGCAGRQNPRNRLHTIALHH